MYKTNINKPDTTIIEYLQNKTLLIGAHDLNRDNIYTLEELLENKLFSKDYLHYFFPFIPQKLSTELDKIPRFDQNRYDELKNYLETLVSSYPRNAPRGTIEWPYENDYLVTFLQDGSLSESIDFPFCGHKMCEYIKEKKDEEEDFQTQMSSVSEILSKKIEKLMAKGYSKPILDIFYGILQQREDVPIKLLNDLGKYIDATERIKLSRLFIDKEYRIFLSDYNNREIKMGGLPKAFYFFFIKHPEGLMLHDVDLYKEELLNIYQLTGKQSDMETINRNIDILTDVADPSSRNVNLSRIKKAFLEAIDDRYACYYYVNGKRGEKKHILLEQNMITFETDIRL